MRIIVDDFVLYLTSQQYDIAKISRLFSDTKIVEPFAWSEKTLFPNFDIFLTYYNLELRL